MLAHTASTDSPLVPVYPSQGTATLDYPVVRLNYPDEPDALDQAARAVAELLLSSNAAAQEAGFRSPDGTLPAPEGCL